MNSCSSIFCQLFSQIDWIWFTLAVIITFIVGAIWYSFLFSKTWIRVFKVEMIDNPPTSLMVRTLLAQLIVNILFGLAFFLLSKLSVALSFFVLIAFCGWQKGTLNFQFPKWKDYVQAALIQVGYTFIVGTIFILMSML